MLSKIKHFYRTVCNFVFCLVMIYKGFNVGTTYRKPLNYSELWKYCKDWEEGKL